MKSALSLLALLLLLAPLVALPLCVVTGCSTDEPSAASVSSPAPLVAGDALAVPAAPSAVAAPDSASIPLPPGVSAPSAAPPTSVSARPAATCGDKPLPACPLAAWMKANTSPAMSAQDFRALAKALEKIVSFAPAGYTNWASISRDGADAARAQTLDGVKASCRGCHNQYKDRYRKEMRDRPI